MQKFEIGSEVMYTLTTEFVKITDHDPETGYTIIFPERKIDVLETYEGIGPSIKVGDMITYMQGTRQANALVKKIDPDYQWVIVQVVKTGVPPRRLR